MARASSRIDSEQTAGTLEREGRGLPGLLMALVVLALPVAAALLVVLGDTTLALVGIGVAVVAGLLVPGFFVVAPKEAKVLILLGTYVGSCARPGSGGRTRSPPSTWQTISLRVRNFQSDRSEVDDASGNPIEIAAVIVWRVVDTGRAVFDVESLESFVRCTASSRRAWTPPGSRSSRPGSPTSPRRARPGAQGGDGLEPADRPAPVRGARALGGRRAAQRQRPDRAAPDGGGAARRALAPTARGERGRARRAVLDSAGR
jgi:hypothetical protein